MCFVIFRQKPLFPSKKVWFFVTKYVFKPNFGECLALLGFSSVSPRRDARNGQNRLAFFSQIPPRICDLGSRYRRAAARPGNVLRTRGSNPTFPRACLQDDVSSTRQTPSNYNIIFLQKKQTKN